MNPTLQTIARDIRAKVKAHFELIGVYADAETYQRARSESDQAIQLARYLGAHLIGVDKRAFGAACGVRLSD